MIRLVTRSIAFAFGRSSVTSSTPPSTFVRTGPVVSISIIPPS